MRTLYDLMNNPVTNPYSINIIEPNVAAAEALKAQLLKLPTVSKVIDIQSLVPDDQQAKLAIIADANSILAPTLMPQPPPAPITPDQIRLATRTALAQIDPAIEKLPKDHPLVAIDGDLHRLLSAPDDVLLATNTALTEFLPEQLDQLRSVLNAEPVTVSSIPPDVARDWLLPDGRARVQVLSTPEARSSKGLAEFVAQVTRIAPNAGGSAVTIEATSATIVNAFRNAAVIAIVSITIILLVALRRVLDVALVLAPLLLSALLTLLVGSAAATAAEFRQHHRLAAAAGGRRIVQHLLRHELAGRPTCNPRFGDGASDRVLGAYDRDRVRIAGPVGPSRHGEHGKATADQPGVHAAGDPGVHPGAAVQRARANQPLIGDDGCCGSMHPTAACPLAAGER